MSLIVLEHVVLVLVAQVVMAMNTPFFSNLKLAPMSTFSASCTLSCYASLQASAD